MPLKSLGRRLALAAALVAFPLVPQATFAADPFDINVILPLTGFGAFLGKSEQVALGIAADSLAESVVRFRRSISAAAFLLPPVFSSACAIMLRSIVAKVCS